MRLFQRYWALTGCKTLRDIETLSEVYAERIPDTTLHDIMVQLDPEGPLGPPPPILPVPRSLPEYIGPIPGELWADRHPHRDGPRRVNRTSPMCPPTNSRTKSRATRIR